MTDDEKIYGPWIKWRGGKCPVPPDTLVDIKLRSGFVRGLHPAGKYIWNHVGDEDDGDIIEYCVVLEQADLDAAEQLLIANGYTITPPPKPLTFEDVTPMTEAPPEGTVYWIVSPVGENGVYGSRFNSNSDFDHRAIKRRMAYLDKEHALIAARHIFGLKGGEL